MLQSLGQCVDVLSRIVNRKACPDHAAVQVSQAFELFIGNIAGQLFETALGLLPIAWHSGQAGHEIEGPMAIVLLGGLISSTVLSLLLLPGMALRRLHFSVEDRS